MGFKCSILGLPNVGKSTLFNALTKLKIATANFPFCTIKTNKGIVPVIDQRLDRISAIVKPKRKIFSFIEFLDVAGLVQGASQGKGLGNQFLASIRETEAICHVVRCFENDNIIHVLGSVDPLRDISIINTELILYDIDICKRAIERIVIKAKSGDKKAKLTFLLLKKCLAHLENTDIRTLRSLNLEKEEFDLIRHLNFLTLKPIMYIANVDEDSFLNNPFISKIKYIAEKENSIVIPVCASFEENTFVIKQEEARSYFMQQKLGLKESSLNYITRAGYKLLNLHTFFTSGSREVRAWSVPVGITALQASSKIHSDFGKGFIRAKTISYEDFITHQGEQGAKEAGKIRSEGKDYIVQDGDILHFLFNI